MCKPRQLRRNRRIALVLCLLGLGLVYRAQILFEVNAHNGVGLFALLHQGLYAGAAGQNGTGLMPAMSVRVGQACFVPSPPRMRHAVVLPRSVVVVVGGVGGTHARWWAAGAVCGGTPGLCQQQAML